MSRFQVGVSWRDPKQVKLAEAAAATFSPAKIRLVPMPILPSGNLVTVRERPAIPLQTCTDRNQTNMTLKNKKEKAICSPSFIVLFSLARFKVFPLS